MERIAIWKDVKPEELVRVENPCFAVSCVRYNLLERRDLRGLKDLMTVCGVATYRSPTEDGMRAVLKRVEEGEWLLVKDQTSHPIDVSRYWYARACRLHGTLPCLDEPVFSGQGPGKWKTISISANKRASGLAFTANFFASLADDGRAFLSAGKDYANTVRVVTQRWVPLDGNELSFARSSAIHQYGKLRTITQSFVEFDDQWDVSGRSWHWRPVVANEVHEFKEG